VAHPDDVEYGTSSAGQEQVRRVDSPARPKPRLRVANAVLFRAFDFHAPPPIALEAMTLAEAHNSLG
jgi:hypothetical protein